MYSKVRWERTPVVGYFKVAHPRPPRLDIQ